MKANKQHRHWRLAAVLATLICLLKGTTAPVVYLPLVIHSLPIQFDTPIWVHNDPPASHEVAHFRRAFQLQMPLEAAELHIFADTRYEVWLDGVWLGRGPARFSQTLREFDVYELGQLAPGEHLIAVIVQWAPNARRSESTAPMLLAHLQGNTQNGLATLARTGAGWKVRLSNAWRADAQPVDTRSLIGPTELLDFRLLPLGWFQPGFDDRDWPLAVVRSAGVQPAGPVSYAPRSIPQLENVPMPAAVQDAGLLSPGFLVGEVLPSADDRYTLYFSTQQGRELILETLSSGPPDVEAFKVDGEHLTWQPAGATRPDVYRAITPIGSGAHRLVIKNIPAQGVTFSVSAPGVLFRDFPFQQGRHAGRRLLLAEPMSDRDKVKALETSNGYNLEFNALPAYLVLDLGRTVHGRVVAEVTGPRGAVVDIGWDERLWTDARRPLPYPGSMYPEWNQVDSWVLDGGARQLTTLDARAGRYLLIAVWGSGPVRFEKLRMYEERYPAAQAGEFHSSDPLLDRIWQVGVDTLRPNMTDALTDTPWRERGQWWGDAYIEDLVGRIAFGDTALLRRGLIYMADALRDSPAPGKAPNNGGLYMLDYTMLWVHNLANEVIATGDVALARRLYPSLQQAIRGMESRINPQTGLLDLPRGHWSATAYIDLLGFSSRYGQSAALNALYAQTFHEAARIAGAVGDADQAALWDERALQVQASLNALLYRPLEGRYLSSIYQGAPVAPALHAQAWPLAYGLTPPGEQARVADALLEMLSPQPAQANVGIYGMHWVLRALGEAGYIERAVQVIRLYYGYLLDAGATTWWEGFTADSAPSASYSHGWGGTPTWFLTTYVLGAERLGPNAWRVKPSFEGVESASGVLPLSAGALQVEWKRPACGEFALRIQSPAGSQGELALPPFHPEMRLRLNGEPIDLNGLAVKEWKSSGEMVVTLGVSGGTYEVVGGYPCGQ